jgi:hypothetical protein
MLALLAAGCQDGTEGPVPVPIQGTVTDGGNPLVVENPQYGYRWVEIAFHEIGDDGQPTGPAVSAEVQPDGSFNLEVPVGKYQVAVYQWTEPGQDELQGRFAHPKSPITRDVTANANIEIDVSKPEG